MAILFEVHLSDGEVETSDEKLKLGSDSRVIAVPSGLFLVTWILASAASQSRVAAAAMAVDPTDLGVAALPPWVSDEIVLDIRGDLARLPAFRLDDPDLNDSIQAALPQVSPWIRSVSAVDKVYPNRVQFAFDLRRPVARIRFGGGRDVAFDGEGMALPPSALSLRTPLGDALPWVVGGREGPPPAPGQRLVFSELLEGLAVAQDLCDRVLGHQRSRLQLVSIDVEGVPYPQNTHSRLSEIVLRVTGADGEVDIQWGRSRRSPAPGALRLSVDQKLRNLATVLAENPGLRGVGAVSVWREEASAHLR